MTNRRVLLKAMGVAPLLAPAALRAQTRAPKLARVGVLWHAGSVEEEGKYYVALKEGFRDVGYVEGRNIVFEHRFPNEEYAKFNAQAAELVRLDLDVIVAVTQPAALALQRTGTTRPIVFLVVPDPVAAKLVASLARPGGNITGFSNIATDLNPKRLQVFKEAVSGLSRVALLVNPQDPNVTRRTIEDVQAAGAALGIAAQPFEARSPAEFESAFAGIGHANVHGLLVASDPLFYAGRARLAELAIAQRLPSMHSNGDAVEAGFLMAYGANHESIFRRTPTYVDKILKGTRPEELPVEQPRQFEIAVNLATARAIGLALPQSIVQRASRVVG